MRSIISKARGKPLDLSVNPFEDPSDRMANRLLKNNGFAPDWIQEAKELAAESRRLRALGEITNDDARSRVASLNRRIPTVNLKTPASHLHTRFFEIES